MTKLDNKAIAIIVPVYNSKKYLRRCIQSIMNQDYPNWQVICIDDGSTDGSGDILEKFAKMDQRIHVIHQENRGPISARRNGVLCDFAQQCEYIVFCDADDELPDHALSILFNTISNLNVDVVCGDMRKLFRNFVFKSKYKTPCFRQDRITVYTSEDIIKNLLISYYGISDFPVALWGKIFRRDVITNAIQGPEVVRFIGEDLVITLRVMTSIQSIALINEVVYHYRIGGGTSKYRPDFMDEFVNLYHYKKEFAERYPIPQDWQLLMDIELLNVFSNHIQQTIEFARKNRQLVLDEVKKWCINPCLQEVSTRVNIKQNGSNEIARLIKNMNYEAIIQVNYLVVKKKHLKKMIKNTIINLQ